APEVQGEEKSYTNLSDIYSLGVLMSYVANDCALTMSGKPEEVEGLDPKLTEIIKKAADPDPQARYQTAAELNKAITSLELYRNLKPHRRAVAAAASFELVKKNGSTIRGVSADAPETDEKIKFPNDPIEARKKERMSLAGKIISAFVTVAAVAALVWFVAADPAGIIRGTGSESVIKDTETKEDEHKDITIIDEGKKTEDETGDKQDEQQPDPAAQEHDENPAENPAENPTENPSENPTEDPNENPGAEPSGEEPVPVEPDPVDPEPIDEPEPEPEPVYLMPSDTRIIKYSELEGLDKREAILVLNEVYARHGRAFKTDWIREYFESQSWYKATSKSDATINAELSKTENANLKTINQYLKDKGYR
ncbi:MAG: YARHG domain-containing protein, partial [Oscillospiraceae bacterium]|nr:YARHG domain-containing protein [Oscillospiraceae bacterium]